jgi:hypothetical protein
MAACRASSINSEERSRATVRSWVSTGLNESISPAEVQRAPPDLQQLWRSPGCGTTADREAPRPACGGGCG